MFLPRLIKLPLGLLVTRDVGLMLGHELAQALELFGSYFTTKWWTRCLPCALMTTKNTVTYPVTPSC